jgi:hypothetical protein
MGGFLMLTLGFLTTVATAAPLDDALGRLDRLEERRGAYLARADSLGRILTDLPDERSDEAGPLLQQASGVEGAVRTLDLEILLQRERCRSLAREELDRLPPVGTEGSDRVARQRQLQEILDGRLSEPLGGDLILVEPDSADGAETLLDKRAYLEDLQERIEKLKDLLRRREERARRERSLIRASEGFREQDQFLDEGGRVGSDETVLLRGLPGHDPDGSGRVPGSGGSGVTEEAFPRGVPEPIETVSYGEGTVREALARLDEGLTRVRAALRSIDGLLRRFESPPR